MSFDKTNTAIVFVENGLFNKEKVESLKKDGNKPVIIVKANFDGVDKEISLWFSTDKETGEYKITQNGNKFLTGKVADPYKAVEYSKTDSTSTTPPEFDKKDDDLPF